MLDSSPASLLSALHDNLLPWVQARGGLLSLAGDPGHVIELLADGPQSFRVILAWQGDSAATDQAMAGIVENTFEVWLIKAKGLKFHPGMELIAGNPPFLSLLSDLRAMVRSLNFPDELTSVWMEYKGSKQFEPELALQLPTTGYKLEFAITSAIPSISPEAIV